MKRLTCLPLLGILFAGCNAPAAQEAAAPANSTPAAPAPPAPAPAPKKTYKIVKAEDIPNPGIEPAEFEKYRAAMKKVEMAPPPLDTKLADKPRLIVDTTRGAFTLELDAAAAPLQVRSFVYLAGKNFFDGTRFHRYADLTQDGKGFIIQGGDPLSKSLATNQYAGQGGPGYEIPREYNDLKHDKLVIAAARTDDPDSAGSQFYITQGPVHFLDAGYTVFGKVVAGQDVALKLRRGDVIKSVKLEK